LLLFHLKQRTCSSENKDATRVLLNSSENKDATQVLFIVGLLRNPVKGKIKMLCTTAVCVIPNSGDIIRQQQLIKNRDGQHQKGEEKTELSMANKQPNQKPCRTSSEHTQFSFEKTS
jgi:hypothetical protein